MIYLNCKINTTNPIKWYPSKHWLIICFVQQKQKTKKNPKRTMYKHFWFNGIVAEIDCLHNRSQWKQVIYCEHRKFGDIVNLGVYNVNVCCVCIECLMFFEAQSPSRFFFLFLNQIHIKPFTRIISNNKSPFVNDFIILFMITNGRPFRLLSPPLNFFCHFKWIFETKNNEFNFFDLLLWYSVPSILHTCTYFLSYQIYMVRSALTISNNFKFVRIQFLFFFLSFHRQLDNSKAHTRFIRIQALHSDFTLDQTLTSRSHIGRWKNVCWHFREPMHFNAMVFK